MVQGPSLGEENFLTASLTIPLLVALSGGLPQQLMLTLRDMAFYAIDPATLRRPQRPSAASPLHEQGINLASVLQGLADTPALEAINDALGAIVGNVAINDVSDVGGYLVTRLREHVHSQHNGERTISSPHQSEGTLRVIGMLTARYQEPPRHLLALEEPELNLHPGAIGVLCDVLQEASLRSQVIITTHSPDVLSRLPVEALRVLEKRAGATSVGLIDAVQRHAILEQLFSAGDLMRIEGLRPALVAA